VLAMEIEASATSPPRWPLASEGLGDIAHAV
jgi:hypothetical protein